MKLRNALLALVALVFSFGALADNHEKPKSLSDVWTFAPKAGMYDDFVAAMAEYKAWREEVGDSRSWNAYTPAVGEKLNRIGYRSCCYNYADQDAYIAEGIEKGYGEKFGEMVGPYVDHMHHHFDQADWENSHWTETADGPYYGVTTWTIDGGYHPKAYAARVKMSQLALDGWASDENQWLWLTSASGAPAISVVSSFSNYAEMEPPEVSFFEFVAGEVGSEDDAHALFKNFGKGKVTSDYTVWRHLEDLSWEASE